MTRFYALMPGGYSDTRDDYSPCDSMGEAIEILDESRIYMGHPALHVFDGGREPWAEVDPYPDYSIEFNSDGTPEVSPV